MEITVPETDSADRLVEMWLDLADGQREHGSHLLVEENEPTIRDAIVRHILNESLLVAQTDQIVGFVMFSIEHTQYEQDLTRGIVQNLYVCPPHRNTGIGSTLLSRAEDRLEADGAERIALEVIAPNDAARRFYSRHGYQPHRIELEKPGSKTDHVE